MAEKLSALPNNTSPALTDSIVSVKSPGGTPQDVLIPISDLGNVLDNTSALYNPYKFSVYRNSALVTAGANTTILFDTELFDTGSNYSVSTGKFTAPAAGLYQFNAAVGVSPYATTSYAITLVATVDTFGGNNITTLSASNGTWVLVVGALIKMSAGDTCYVVLYDGHGGANTTVETGTSNTFFTGFLVSAT